MFSGRLIDARQERLQSLLERTAIEQIGQRIMTRLIAQFFGQTVGVTDIPTRPSVTAKLSTRIMNGFFPKC